MRVWKTAAADASVVVAATHLEDYLVPLFDNECYLLTDLLRLVKPQPNMAMDNYIPIVYIYVVDGLD